MFTVMSKLCPYACFGAVMTLPCTLYDAQDKVLAYATDGVKNDIGRNYSNDVLHPKILKHIIAAYNYFLH